MFRLPRACALLACISLGCASLGSPDPVVTDPTQSGEFPASMTSVVIESHGARLNGIVYLAQGPGPHPQVVLLHGYPGDERNLDLAQAIRRSGWNVIFFHYRGAWGSGGRFSFGNALADVDDVVALAQTRRFLELHRADPDRIALVGHSMGGFMALTAGSSNDSVDCVASLSGANLGGMAAGLAEDPEMAKAMAQRLDGISGPIQGTSGAELVAEIGADPAAFDTTGRAADLANKPLLLVAGARDAVTPPGLHHAPLVAALEAAGAHHLEATVLDSDHAYSDRRIALARRVVSWLNGSCSDAGT